MNITKKILIFLLLLGTIVLHAQSNRKDSVMHSPDLDTIHVKSHKKAGKHLPLVYKPEKTFVFQADYDSAGTKKTNYVVMRILDKEQYGGTVITYDYYDSQPHQHNMDSLSSISERGFIESTQVLDKGNIIWLHPPRTEYLPPRNKDLVPRSLYRGLTDYFPFPYMSLPAKVGKKTSELSLSINDPICDCNLGMKYSVFHIGYTQYKYQNKLITVVRTDGISKNKKIGNYSFQYLFNEEFGFVHWKYNCNDIVFLELNLIDVY